MLMIGRKREQEALNRLYDGKKAELVAVFGRRRVGKTYLIDETFEGRFTFKHAGLSPAGEDPRGLLQKQLLNFYNSLILAGMSERKPPKSWMEAFLYLELFLQSKDDGSRQLVFLDELPWMDTPRSGFISAFEGFWNNFACHRKNMMVIVCGSANAWIQDKLINNHGGLYNRVTYEIRLRPFTLHECEEFFKDNGISFSRYDIVQSYMVFGGVPFYLGCLNGSLSIPQNIDELFFTRDARLENEFDRLFSSLFINPEYMKSIVRQLYQRRKGYTRKEIAEALGINANGQLSQNLNALIYSDFVVKYVPYGESAKREYYRLIDPFCLFYLHFADGKKREPHYWENNLTSQSTVVWKGLAFENVCFDHVEQIKKALGVSGVASQNSAWTGMNDDNEGMQIDLIIARNDNIINLCEMKFAGEDFRVDKNYYRKLLGRQSTVAAQVSKKASVRNTLVTTLGLVHNEYSSVFSNVVLLDDLFEK